VCAGGGGQLWDPCGWVAVDQCVYKGQTAKGLAGVHFGDRAHHGRKCMHAMAAVAAAAAAAAPAAAAVALELATVAAPLRAVLELQLAVAARVLLVSLLQRPCCASDTAGLELVQHQAAAAAA
jgi:hypothetical protein